MMAPPPVVGAVYMLRLVLFALPLVLVGAIVAAQAGAEPTERALSLRKGVRNDPTRLPLLARHPIIECIPTALVAGDFRVEVEQRSLSVDVSGRGRRRRRVSATKPAVLTFETAEDRVALLVFALGGGWWAAPATMWRGRDGKQDIEVLAPRFDAEGHCVDGWWRWGAGAFRPVSSTGTVQVENGWLDVDLRRTEAGVVASLRFRPRPEGTSDARWEGLRAVNDFRHRVGLEPVALDEARCQACQKHADYIRLNPEDGFGHDEIEGRPGFHPEGLRAARASVMERTADPWVAVGRLTATMLHRPPFLHTPDQPLGIGTVCTSVGWTSYGTPGFTVLWAGEATTSRTFPVVVPAPGWTDVPRACVPELPEPEGHPGFYTEPHGYPVSVSFLPRGLRDVRIRLERAGPNREVVPGFLFTPRDPVHSLHAHNHETAFFVPQAPLQRETGYVAVFEANDGNGPIRYVWNFCTTR